MPFLCGFPLRTLRLKKPFLPLPNKTIPMSQEETSHLRAEIARLNKIINVLLEQNDAIKASYSQLLLRFEEKNLTERKIYTHSGINTPTQSQVETNLGINTPTQSQLSTHTGVTTTTQSQPPTHIGLNTPVQSHLPTDLGLNRPLHPDTPTPIPLNTLPQSNTPQGVPPQQQTVILPEQIIPSNTLFSSVAHKLEAAGFIRVKNNTRQTAAQLMVHFHNGGSGDYAGLQKLTGYSAGGLSKLLITLRKRGFIQRTGYGKYGLTEKGKQILAEAV